MYISTITIIGFSILEQYFSNEPNIIKRILVINCGGTISMKKEHGVYVPKKGNILEIIDKSFYTFKKVNSHIFKIRGHSKFGFEIKEMDSLIDSANLQPKDWIELVKTIEDNLDYDAFVILHGTDTLAYTASALSFMIQNLKKTIIVTGSQIPLAESRSDGLGNFLGALIIAGKYDIENVNVFFDHKLFRGNRVKKVSCTSINAFNSPNAQIIGRIEVYPEIFSKNKSTKIVDHFFHKKVSLGIRVVKIYPDFDCLGIESFNSENTKAIILETFGNGNAPTNKSFLDSIRRLIEDGIVIVNVTQCLHGSVTVFYEPCSELAHIGVISGKDVTTEAMFAKLHYLFSKYEDLEEIKKRINKNICGEMSE